MADGQSGAASGLTGARIALLVAALIAVAAVAVAVLRGRETAAPVVTPTGAPGQPQPTVEEMVAKLQEKLKQNPGDAEGWRMLGWSYYRMQRFPDSVAAYRRAVVADPKNAEGWSALGEALALAQNDSTVPAEAVAAFNKALAIDAKDPRARYFLAVKKDLDGDHKGAIDDWIALLEDTPAGAPWEENVRATIKQVADKNKIALGDRVPAPTAPPAPDNVATAGIPGPTQEQLAAASSIPPSQQDEMVKGMVAKLAARLKDNPKDADGWIRLMRARMVMNDPDAAKQALADGRTAFAGDKPTQDRLSNAAKTLAVPGA